MSFRIPLKLRTMAFRASRNKPVKLFGEKLYAMAAQLSAKQLKGIHGVREVYLRGGYLRKCDPGITDLDFLIQLDPTTKTEAELFWQLHRLYRRLKTSFPVMGEIDTISPPLWKQWESLNPASLLAFDHRFRYVNQRWEHAPTSPRNPVRPESLFAFCLDFYTQANQHIYDKKRSSKEYYEIRIQKELSKLLRYAGVEHPPESTTELFAHSFHILKNLALEPNPPSPIDISCVEVDADTCQQPDPIGKLVSHHWFKSLKKALASEFELEETQTPYFYTIEGLTNPTDSTHFFKHYLKALEKHPKQTAPCLILSPESYHCYLNGWSYGSPLKHLRWITDEQAQNTNLMQSCAEGTFLSLTERACHQLNAIGGQLIHYSGANLSDSIRQFCQIAFILATKVLSPNWEELRYRCSKTLPHTVHLYRRLSNESTFYQDELLYEEIGATRNEVSDLIETLKVST